VFKASGGDVTALSDVSLDIKPGRFVVLVGPSGCGKSTLLIMLAEMYASRDGIGHEIATWGENFQMKQLLAGVVMIAAIAMTFNELIRWVETRCSHWRT
jgi:ABC-type nitrate/sulfonate/bicarbonate transport system ATPase subunit